MLGTENALLQETNAGGANTFQVKFYDLVLSRFSRSEAVLRFAELIPILFLDISYSCKPVFKFFTYAYE